MIAAKCGVPALSAEAMVQQMPASEEPAARPADNGAQCAPVAMSQVQQQPAGLGAIGHNVIAENAAAEGVLPRTGGQEGPQAMQLSRIPAEGLVAAPPPDESQSLLLSNGSCDASGQPAGREPPVATPSPVAQQALPEAQQAWKPSALRSAVSETTPAPAADSKAELETASAAAAAHEAHMRSMRAQLAAQARWKKHRQNSSAAGPALTAGLKRARQPVVRQRTRAPRVASAATDRPASDGTSASMVEGTNAAAPGSGRRPARDRSACLAADADGDRNAHELPGDSEPGNAMGASDLLSLQQQAAAGAECYWLHPPWMADHPPPPHLQVPYKSVGKAKNLHAWCINMCTIRLYV